MGINVVGYSNMVQACFPFMAKGIVGSNVTQQRRNYSLSLHALTTLFCFYLIDISSIVLRHIYELQYAVFTNTNVVQSENGVILHLYLLITATSL